MHIIQEVKVRYKKVHSTDRIQDIDQLMKDHSLLNSTFEFFFELHEDHQVVVFATVSGYELTKEEQNAGEGRIFQVETAVLVKDAYADPAHRNVIFYLGDNDGIDSLTSVLKDKPVWVEKRLREAGVQRFDHRASGTPYKDYRWNNYVKEQEPVK